MDSSFEEGKCWTRSEPRRIPRQHPKRGAADQADRRQTGDACGRIVGDDVAAALTDYDAFAWPRANVVHAARQDLVRCI